MTRRLLNLVTALAMVTSCGCSAGRVNPPGVPPSSGPPPVVAPVTPAADHPVQPTSAPTDGWVYWQVSEGEAETVLVAVISAGGGVARHEVPLRRYPPGERPWPDVIGDETGGASQGPLSTAEQSGVYDSFVVADDPSAGVTLRRSSVRGGFIGFIFNVGGFGQRLLVPVGRPSEHRLSEDATLAVSFREPKRVPIVPPVEPAWEKELAREREDGTPLPLPPPWGTE